MVKGQTGKKNQLLWLYSCLKFYLELYDNLIIIQHQVVRFI